MFKLIIAGGREFNDYTLVLRSCLDYIVENNLDIMSLEIVSGGARGADKLGEQLAKETNKILKIFPANWDLHGKSAGYKRNTEMANYADGLLAFWDGKSKGTKHMIDLANSKGLKVKVVNY